MLDNECRRSEVNRSEVGIDGSPTSYYFFHSEHREEWCSETKLSEHREEWCSEMKLFEHREEWCSETKLAFKTSYIIEH